MASFVRSFWLGLLVTAAAGFLAAGLCFRPMHAALPPRPPFPLTAATFVNDYGSMGSACHYLYRFGLFGIGERLRQSDVLLLGSSHVEFGFSAAQLARELSTAAGRPVRVYNLGLGFGEGVPFDRGILEANRLREKACVVDLYVRAGDTPSPFAAKVDRLNALGAALKVADLWLRAADDWLLDPWLPRVRLRDEEHGVGPPVITRMLDVLDTRAWASGDAVEFWSPRLGLVYTHPELGTLPPPDQNSRITRLNLSGADWDILQEARLRPVFTLLPWNSEVRGDPHNVAPYIAISPDGLSLFDTFHLNTASRTIATDRLFQGLPKEDALKTWLGMNRPASK